jgi:hypothetical protein
MLLCKDKNRKRLGGLTMPKNPTPQGISALLRKAGFDRAEVIRGGRRHGENTAGYHVHAMAGEVRVNHWPATVLPTARTTKFAQEERRQTLEMLDRYAEAIQAAGWTVTKVRAFTMLAVTAPKDEA